MGDELVETARIVGIDGHAEAGAGLDLVAGDCLTAKEAFKRELGALREQLVAGASSELERLLCGRVALCWLHMNAAEVDYVSRLNGASVTSPSARAALQRLDRAHSRFLSASRTLATVRRLRPGPSPLDLIRNASGDRAVDAVRPQEAFGASRLRAAVGVG